VEALSAPAPPEDAAPARRIAALVAHKRVEVLTSATVVGWYDEGILAVDCRPDLLLLSPDAVVLASGGYDRGLPFAGWDLPGVMLAAGVQRLLQRYRLRPGSRAVVVTMDDFGYGLARQMQAAGVEIVCVADTRPRGAIQRELLDEAANTGMPVRPGASGGKAHGFNAVSAFSLRLEESGASRTVKYECDLVCISAGTRPADDLAYQALSRGSVVLSVGEPAPGSTGPWLAGLVAGAGTAELANEQGAAAGSAAAMHVVKGGVTVS
jgi:sarcosine oxidase subunit alpha